jgi:hypothetical protein
MLVIQIELGTACGKLFRCATMSILDAGKFQSIRFMYFVADMLQVTLIS